MSTTGINDSRDGKGWRTSGGRIVEVRVDGRKLEPPYQGAPLACAGKCSGEQLEYANAALQAIRDKIVMGWAFPSKQRGVIEEVAAILDQAGFPATVALRREAFPALIAATQELLDKSGPRRRSSTASDNALNDPPPPGSREAAMVVIETENGIPTVWCDPEIADLIRALNAAGVRTVASCSGHGERPGGIILRDGREMIILPNYECARTAERLVHGDKDVKAFFRQPA